MVTALKPPKPKGKPTIGSKMLPPMKTFHRGNAKAAADRAERKKQGLPPLKPLPKLPKVDIPKELAVEDAIEIELADRELSRRQLIPFVKRHFPKYDVGWVHEDIARRLEQFSRDVAAGLSPRLMLLVPPRHGKSELASKNFPAWHLGHYPDHEFIACSYNVDLARDFSRAVKGLLTAEEYGTVFETRLDEDNRSAESWKIAGSRGGYVAAGVGGPITGKGAHVLVIDDPIKNAEEADSPEGRNKIWQWFLSTAYSRLAPGGGVLIIQTWWHDDDLAGRLQQVMAEAIKQAEIDGEPVDEDVDMYDVVKYPAIATEDEYLDTATNKIVAECPADGRLLRRQGEALHPARYDLKKLRRIRRQNQNQDGSDGRWWSALYQQNPVPDDGDYFLKQQFRQREVPPIKVCNVFIAWDFAITEKRQSDYNVGVVMLQDTDDVLHVADVTRFKSNDTFFIIEAMLNLVTKWYSPTAVLGVEDGQIWKTMKVVLEKRMKERKMYPSIIPLTPITDKMVRGRPLQGRMQQGMVSFNKKAPWFDVMRNEMLRFPAGRHDDQVDAAAWACTLAYGRSAPQRPKEKETESWMSKLNQGLRGGSHMTS